jgi:large subunit ribosomal protein L2
LPERSPVAPLKKNGGRNSYGRITTRHGRRSQAPLPYHRLCATRTASGKVAHIEYDPNRTARIALLHYADGEKRYILAPKNLAVGDTVESGPAADIKAGNALPLENIPSGTTIHNIELHRRGGQLVRSAGTSAQLQAKEWHGVVRLPSGELRCIRLTCRATVGEPGNPTTRTSRRQGRPYRWRGVPDRARHAMNLSTPHGGGEARRRPGVIR